MNSRLIKRKCGAPRKGTPGLYQWPLEEQFWDFRAVNPEDARLVAYYEYAASCDWIRKCWKQWTNQAFPGWSREWLSDEFSVVKWDLGKIESIGTVLRRLAKFGIHPTDGDQVTKVLLATMPEKLKCGPFESIIYAAPDYPTPWLKLNPSSRMRLKSLWRRICRYRKSHAVHVFEIGEPVSFYRSDPANENIIFDVKIDWYRPEKEILTSFKQWLAKAYRSHGKNGKRKIKRSDDYNPLRWLSALRLHRAGLSFSEAKEISTRLNRKKVSKTFYYDLPVLGQGTWNNYLTHARNHGHDLFPEPAEPVTQSDLVLPSSFDR